MSSKRNGNHWPNNVGPSPKRTKLDNKPVTNSSQSFIINDDVWGDFDEDKAVEDLDFIVSQEFMQVILFYKFYFILQVEFSTITSRINLLCLLHFVSLFSILFLGLFLIWHCCLLDFRMHQQQISSNLRILQNHLAVSQNHQRATVSTITSQSTKITSQNQTHCREMLVKILVRVLNHYCDRTVLIARYWLVPVGLQIQSSRALRRWTMRNLKKFLTPTRRRTKPCLIHLFKTHKVSPKIVSWFLK